MKTRHDSFRSRRHPSRRPFRATLESLEPRTLLDAGGPRITAITPKEVIDGTFDHVDVTWNEAIDATTFTAGDVTVSGPPGSVAVTGITKLDDLDYRVSFNALSVRGLYQVVIGPTIADPSGKLMNQDGDNNLGEPTDDQFRSSLTYVVAQTVFTSDTVISETNTTYDGQDIAIKGATVTIDGPHSFDSVHLIDGSVLTHSANTATQTHKLDLNVTQQVIVDSTSKIDVTGNGYLPGRTTGNTAGFGSHGGLVGSTPVYDNYADPDDWGSGGSTYSGAAGGGLVRMAAATLALDGQILADGQGGGLDAQAAGGGIFVTAETLTGSGLIRAGGGTVGQGYGGAGGGGGRIAVYAKDFSGFNTSRITAPGGNNPGGGAGTVYLRDPDEPSGTLIIDAASSGNGVTPLGLPGQTSFTIPDAVVIQGARTHVQPEHSGLVLEFKNSLTIQQSATLSVEGAGFLADVAPTILTGANLNVAGDVTLGVPLQVTNGNVTVSGVLTSTVPQTITGGTITTDHLVAPTWSPVQGAVLTSFASTSTQMHELEVQIDGTLTVDASSKIDVTGKGYLGGRTTGNTTVGGATGTSGGSYGGRGTGNTNAVYGDYADPEDWGSGGGYSGGGLVRIVAGTVSLNGGILAQGPNGNWNGYNEAAGSGGGIYLSADTLTGTGQITADGGSANPASGGGGRIAVYARDYSGFSLNNIHANGGGGGGAGTVYTLQGQPHTHVQAHFPYGVGQGFVDHGNDYVSQPIDSITLRFNNPIGLSSFDLSKFQISGQMGQITPTGIEQVGDTTYRIDLPFSLTENGPYNFTLLSTALKDFQGFPLDQNANGTPGEILADDYAFTLTVDTVPPRITHQDPAGDLAGTVDYVDVSFSETIETSTFAAGDITILRPDGKTVGVTGIQNVGLNRFRISFPAQTLVGVYHVKAGPSVTDLAGNSLDQNGNDIGGEPTDVYDGTVNIVPVNLGLNGLAVNPSGTIWAGEPVTVSWAGANLSGAPLLGDWIDAVYLSKDDQWDINDIRIATLPHTGGLAENQAYPGSVTVPVPGVLPGSYHILVRADIANQERETNEADNLVASGSLALNVRELPGDGTVVNGQVSSADPYDFYVLHTDSGDSFRLDLTSNTPGIPLQLYVRYAVVPSTQSFDQRSATPVAQQELSLTTINGPGTYYILVSSNGNGLSASYSLTAERAPFFVTDFSPERQGIAANANITITGAGFDASTTLALVNALGQVRGVPVKFVSDSTLIATIDFSQVLPPSIGNSFDWQPGIYSLQLTKGVRTVTLPSTFEVLAQGHASLQTNLVVPVGVNPGYPVKQTPGPAHTNILMR